MTRKLAFGLIILCLTLSACADKPCPPARPVMPPVVFLQHRPEPPSPRTAKTNGELMDIALAHEAGLKASNEDKAALREWAAGL